ncbi:hypothetical protein R5R35_003598 [Gryllus longicercus]|uniref:Retrotransposon gag domain-containing protein n=1 Tax=Gryllus longicercus TaxID=2509291 RepID=A0AAN9VCK1_9ORTH
MAGSQDYREPRQIRSDEDSEGDAGDEILRRMENLGLHEAEEVREPTADRTESAETTPEQPSQRTEEQTMQTLMQALLGNFARHIGIQVENQGRKLSEKIEKSDERMQKLSEETKEQSQNLAAEIKEQSRKLEDQGRKSEEQSRKSEELVQKLAAETKEQSEKLAVEIKEQSRKSEEQIQKLAEKIDNQTTIFNEKFEQFQQSIMSEVVGKCDELRGEIAVQVATCTQLIEERHAEVGARIDSISTEIQKKDEENKARFGEIQNEVQEVRGQVTEISANTKRQVEEQVTRKLEEQERKIQELREIAESKVGGGACRGSNINIPASLRFSGHPNENPNAFIKSLQSFFVLSNVREAHKTLLLHQALEGNAKAWLETLCPMPNSFDEFVVRFLDRYWGKEQQMNFKISLMSGYYRTSSGTMRDYAARKIAALKMCSPPVADEEIICILTRHFPLSIQNLLRSVDVKDVEKFQILLGNYDLTFENMNQTPKTTKSNINAMQVIQDTVVSSSKKGGSKNKGESRQHGQDARPRNEGTASGELRGQGYGDEQPRTSRNAHNFQRARSRSPRNEISTRNRTGPGNTPSSS